MAGQKQFDPTVALDQAVQVFWRHGYHLASVDALTKATGLGRGSLYGTFGSKDQLFIACLRRYMSKIGAENAAALTSRPDDHRAAIGAFFTAIIDRFERPENPPGCMGANTAHEWADLDAQSRDAAQEITATQTRAIEDVFLEARRRKHLPAEIDIPTLAAYVLGTSHMLAMMDRSGAEIASIRAVAELALNAIPAGRS